MSDKIHQEDPRMIPLRLVSPTPEMQAARLAMLDAVRSYADAIGGVGLLACAAYTVGQLIALQDQRKLTPDMAMQLVNENIVAGNQAVVGALASAGGELKDGGLN